MYLDLDDTDRYQISGDLTLQSQMTATISVQLGDNVRYEHPPFSGKLSTDRTLPAGLVNVPAPRRGAGMR